VASFANIFHNTNTLLIWRLKSFFLLRKLFSKDTNFFVCVVLGLELRAYTFRHPTSPFCQGFFWDRVLQIICLGWIWTAFLLICASYVARVTGMSHWYPVSKDTKFFATLILFSGLRCHLSVHGVFFICLPPLSLCLLPSVSCWLPGQVAGSLRPALHGHGRVSTCISICAPSSQPHISHTVCFPSAFPRALALVVLSFLLSFISPLRSCPQNWLLYEVLKPS
jgi:hypothetical protein